MEIFIYKFVFYILILLLGGSFGSFIGAISIRLGKTKDILKVFTSSSKCDNCGEQIGTFDLIPILSFLFLKGKCKSCSSKIGLKFLFIEIFSGIFVLLSYILFENAYFSFDYLIYSILIFETLLFLGFYDYLYWEVPIEFVAVFSFFYLCILFVFPIYQTSLISQLISGLVGMAIIFSIIYISNWEGLGFGDVWVFGLVGLVFGWKKLIIIFILSIIFGGLFALFALITKNKTVTNKKMVQFIPFVSIAGIVLLIDRNNSIFQIVFPFELQWYWYMFLFVIFILSTFVSYTLLKGKILK